MQAITCKMREAKVSKEALLLKVSRLPRWVRDGTRTPGARRSLFDFVQFQVFKTKRPGPAKQAEAICWRNPGKKYERFEDSVF